MKVLLIGNYPPPYGGISVQIQHLRGALPQSGIECQVLNIDLRCRTQSTEYIAVKGRLDFVCKLLRFARSGYLLHLFTNGENWKSWVVMLIVGAVGWVSNSSSIVTITSGGAPVYLARCRPRGRALVRLALSLPTAIVCRTEAIARAIGGWRATGVSVLSAFSASRLRPADCPPEAVVSFASTHQPLLVSVAILRREYDVATLLQAFSDLRTDHPATGLVVVGGGEEEAKIRDLVRRLELGGSVLLAGWVPHSECLAIIREADVFVRTTLYDGDASSVREALALGVPVVATKTGFRPEGVILAPAGDADALRARLTDVLAKRDGKKTLSPPSTMSSDAALVTLYKRLSASPKQSLLRSDAQPGE